MSLSEFEMALRPLIVAGMYRVVVTSARRDDRQSHAIRLSLAVVDGAYEGTTVPVTIKEQHEGQTKGGRRHYLRALWALGFKPNDEGVIEYEVDDFEKRQCKAELVLEPDHRGIPRVSVDHDGLLPLEVSN